LCLVFNCDGWLTRYLVPSSIPSELLVNILSFVDGARDDGIVSLRSCSLASRGLRHISQTYLFAHICLHRPTELDAFTALLDGSPHIAPLVHHLSVSPKMPGLASGSESSLHEAVILHLSSRLPNLTHLRLSNPFFITSGDFRIAFICGFQALQSLYFDRPILEPNEGYRAFLECCLRHHCLESFGVERDQPSQRPSDGEPSAMAHTALSSLLRSPPSLQISLKELTLTHVSMEFWKSLELFCASTEIRATRARLVVGVTQLPHVASCLSALGNSLENLEFRVFGLDQNSDLSGMYGH
jgi:hypothetical protein